MLQEFMLQDHKASVDARICNNKGRVEIAHIVRRSYNPVGYPPPPAASASNDYENRKQGKREERRCEEIDIYDIEGNNHDIAQTYSPRPTPGANHSVNSDDEENEDDGQIRLPAGLVGSTDQCACAESVLDNGNERL